MKSNSFWVEFGFFIRSESPTFAVIFQYKPLGMHLSKSWLLSSSYKARNSLQKIQKSRIFSVRINVNTNEMWSTDNLSVGTIHKICFPFSSFSILYMPMKSNVQWRPFIFKNITIRSINLSSFENWTKHVKFDRFVKN